MLVKGTSVRNILLAVEGAFGAHAVERVRAALTDEVRGHVDRGVLASRMYPVGVSAELHTAIQRELGGGSIMANRRVGMEAAQIDFGGVYRVFLRMKDFRSLLEGLDRAWRQYNSRGHVRWTNIGDGTASGEIEGVDGFNEGMWHSIAGRLETILLLAGAKKASVQVNDCSPQYVKFAVRWSA